MMERRQKGLAWKRTADVVRDFIVMPTRAAVRCSAPTTSSRSHSTQPYLPISNQVFRTLVIADEYCVTR